MQERLKRDVFTHKRDLYLFMFPHIKESYSNTKETYSLTKKTSSLQKERIRWQQESYQLKKELRYWVSKKWDLFPHRRDRHIWHTRDLFTDKKETYSLTKETYTDTKETYVDTRELSTQKRITVLSFQKERPIPTQKRQTYLNKWKLGEP